MNKKRPENGDSSNPAYPEARRRKTFYLSGIQKLCISKREGGWAIHTHSERSALAPMMHSWAVPGLGR